MAVRPCAASCNFPNMQAQSQPVRTRLLCWQAGVRPFQAATPCVGRHIQCSWKAYSGRPSKRCLSGRISCQLSQHSQPGPEQVYSAGQQPAQLHILASSAATTLLAAACNLGPGTSAVVAQELAAHPAAASALYQLADLDGRTAGVIATVLRPILSLATLMLIVRIVLSWYPQINSKKLPWSIAYFPTEPVLGPTRRLVPPVGGVDVSPIIWVAIISFINEILLGPQGILNLLQRKADLMG